MSTLLRNPSYRVLLILPDAAQGGGHTMNLRLADQLTQRGWTIDIVFLFDRYDYSAHARNFPGLQQIRMHADSRAQRALLPLRLGRLARGYHLVLAGLDLAATNYGYLAARLAGRPFISWMHIAFNEHSRSVSRISRAISLWFYRHTPNIVFPSTGSRDSLAQALGGQPASAAWHIIENFHGSGHASQSKRAMGTIPEHIFARPVVLSVGRLSEQKAYDRLIRIHTALWQRGIKHHLVILGEGPERRPLEALAAQLGVTATFFLPGHVPDPRAWFEASTAFALCSRYEGLPLVLIEALQSGTPIASMDCPSGPREILDNGEGGLLVPAGDENALADAIARLLSNPELCAAFRERGRQKAKTYEPEVIIPRWEALLGRLISAALPKRPHLP